MDYLTRLLVSMLDELGRISEEPGRLTRTFLSPAMERALKLVGSWMQDFGLDVRVDKTGNLIGRLEARVGSPLAGAKRARANSLAHKKPRTLLLGSHLDTVRDAGQYDGALGVLLPLVALHELGRRGVKLPFHVEIVGFSEEEGVRFASAYLGSKAYTGRLRESDLKLRDAEGISVREAIQRWSGLTPSRSKRAGVSALHLKAAHQPSDLLGYVEVHIEQGPVLETENLAVGVVSAIAGQSRFRLTWAGKAGHAGTTPMNLRRDAFSGAAEFALAAEKLARATPGLVATVGSVAVLPGAANVIPGQTGHTLDVRHARDALWQKALFQLGWLAARIASRRGLRVSWQRTQDNAAVNCSPQLSARLERSIEAVQGRSLRLVSGAGHDAVVMSALTPVAMLFVRCRDGLSHHPDEHVAPKDLAMAIKVMVDFLLKLAVESD